MEWKLLSTSFVAIFLAEMGDKTQIAAFALAGGSSSKWLVFAGACLALIASTGRHLPGLTRSLSLRSR